MTSKRGSKKPEENITQDLTAPARKQDHIELAFQSQTGLKPDERFYYEPLLSAHPKPLKPFRFLGKIMQAPLWISSMTGGTELAFTINHNLAKACKEFGLGMGLGSCRSLLYHHDYFKDFNLRPVIGDACPFYANLGIAQVEESLAEGRLFQITEMLKKLEADGLIVHVNPLQEWLQPEGDKISQPPIDTIKRLLDKVKFKIIVKEVGQGMGPESLKALLKLPLAAVDFAAHGGTNFSKVELLRSKSEQQALFENVAYMGHRAEEMAHFTNQILKSQSKNIRCKEVIISGGVKSFLDGFYLIKKLNCRSVYGQGSAFLEHARGDYEKLQDYVAGQIKGLELAEAYLTIR